MGMLALLELAGLVCNLTAVRGSACFTQNCIPEKVPYCSSNPLKYAIPSFGTKPTKSKKVDCTNYIDTFMDGKKLFDNCIKKHLCELDPHDELKPEECQLILTYFKELQQFIIAEPKKYDQALKECNIFVMFMIARFQFDIFCSKPYFALLRCERLLSAGGSNSTCLRIVSDTQTFSLEQKSSNPCIMPFYLIEPKLLLSTQREVDEKLFRIILTQIRKAGNKLQCDFSGNAYKRFTKRFETCINVCNRNAVIRVKLVLILMITDFRTNRLDCTFERYLRLLVWENESPEYINVDPLCKYLFGFKCT